MSETTLEVLKALEEIQHALKLQSERLAGLQQQRRNEYESGPAILRRLVELERLVRGGDLHIPLKTTRARPLGTS